MISCSQRGRQGENEFREAKCELLKASQPADVTRGVEGWLLGKTLLRHRKLCRFGLTSGGEPGVTASDATPDLFPVDCGASLREDNNPIAVFPSWMRSPTVGLGYIWNIRGRLRSQEEQVDDMPLSPLPPLCCTSLPLVKVRMRDSMAEVPIPRKGSDPQERFRYPKKACDTPREVPKPQNASHGGSNEKLKFPLLSAALPQITKASINLFTGAPRKRRYAY